MGSTSIRGKGCLKPHKSGTVMVNPVHKGKGELKKRTKKKTWIWMMKRRKTRRERVGKKNMRC